jgi:hypothetical protein
MPKTSTAVQAYIASLPEPRRSAIAAVRDVVAKNLPAGYEETVDYGMLAYVVPLKVHPETYNGKPLMYAALASQKSHMALYLCNAYASPGLRRELEAGFRANGKKVDMGKSCIRFRALEDLPLDVIGRVVKATPVKEYVAIDVAAHSKEATAARSKARGKGGAATKAKTAKKKR